MTRPWIHLEEPTTAELADAVLELSPSREHGVLALVAEDSAALVATVQETARRAERALVGGLVPGLMADGAFVRRGVLLGRFDASTPRRLIAVGPDVQAGVDELVQFVAEQETSANDTLLLLVDTMLGDIAIIVDGAYRELGDSVTYAGTCVGSETFKPTRCLFDETSFIDRGVFGLLMRGRDGVTLGHGYKGSEALWVATTAEGSRVMRIGGRPAFDVYRELVRTEYGVEIDRTTFYQHGVHFPLALSRGHGEPLVRIPIKVDEEGCVYCSGDVPENTLLSVVRAVPAGEVATARAIGEGTRDAAASSVLAFYCAGRLAHLGVEEATHELAAIGEAAGRPLYGALSLGEIGAARATYPAFHNATIVAVPWS